MTTQPHPDCVCQSSPLDRADYDQMMKARKYEEINAAFAAGRFHLNDDK